MNTIQKFYRTLIPCKSTTMLIIDCFMPIDEFSIEQSLIAFFYGLKDVESVKHRTHQVHSVTTFYIDFKVAENIEATNMAKKKLIQSFCDLIGTALPINTNISYSLLVKESSFLVEKWETLTISH